MLVIWLGVMMLLIVLSTAAAVWLTRPIASFARRLGIFVLLSLALNAAFFALTYLPLAHFSWLPGLPFFDGALPAAWVLFALYAWSYGAGPVQRLAPLAALLLTAVAFELTAHGAGTLAALRYEGLTMFCLGTLGFAIRVKRKPRAA